MDFSVGISIMIPRYVCDFDLQCLELRERSHLKFKIHIGNFGLCLLDTLALLPRYLCNILERIEYLFLSEQMVFT